MLLNKIEELKHRVQVLSEEKNKRCHVLESMRNEVDKIVEQYEIPIEPNSWLNKITFLDADNFNELQVDLPIDHDSMLNIRHSFDKVNKVVFYRCISHTKIFVC